MFTVRAAQMELNQSTKTLHMAGRLRKVQSVWLTFFGHTHAIYKLKANTCINFSESTFNRFKVMEAIPI